MFDFYLMILAIALWFILPMVLGGLAIWLPFRIHARRGSDLALVVGILNAVFCGLAVLALGATLAFSGYPTFLPHIVIAVGTLAMLGVVAFAKDRRKRRVTVVNGPVDSRWV